MSYRNCILLADLDMTTLYGCRACDTVLFFDNMTYDFLQLQYNTIICDQTEANKISETKHSVQVGNRTKVCESKKREIRRAKIARAMGRLCKRKVFQRIYCKEGIAHPGTRRKDTSEQLLLARHRRADTPTKVARGRYCSGEIAVKILQSRYCNERVPEQVRQGRYATQAIREGVACEVS